MHFKKTIRAMARECIGRTLDRFRFEAFDIDEENVRRAESAVSSSTLMLGTAILPHVPLPSSTCPFARQLNSTGSELSETAALITSTLAASFSRQFRIAAS